MIEAWTGPQVAWSLARGYDGGIGGKTINSLPVWLGFCGVFLLGLVDWRRLRNVRNLDLLVLLSFSVSLWFFNDADIFTSVPLVYPPLVYLLAARDLDRRPRPAAGRARGVAGLGARRRDGVPRGLPDRPQRRGVERHRRRLLGRRRRAADRERRGAVRALPRRRLHPEGMRARGRRRVRRRPDPDERPLRVGEPERRHLRPRRISRLPPRLPGLRVGRRRRPPDAARFTTVLFDLLCIIGLALVGRRYGGNLLAATLAFAWAAYPFTQYVVSSNSNDSIAPALLIWGFWLAGTAWARGAFLGLAGWTKFFALPLLPLWLSYERRRLRTQLLVLAGFAAATLAAFSVLLLEPDVRACRARLLGPDARMAARPSVAVLAVGLGPVPRGRHPRPRARPPRARGAPARRRHRALLRAAPQVAAPARRASAPPCCSASRSC